MDFKILQYFLKYNLKLGSLLYLEIWYIFFLLAQEILMPCMSHGLMLDGFGFCLINPLTPNGLYSGRAASPFK